MVKKEQDKIIFSYPELFTDVCILSSYMAKSFSVDSGKDIDEFVITSDEKDVYEVCLRQTLPYIYDALLKVSSGIENSFNGSAVFSIVDNGQYNSNVLTSVDLTLRECLSYGVLTEFYSINVNAELFNVAQGKYRESLRQLQQRLFQLKKKSISSNI